MGQIYVPWINWLLLVAVLTLVFTFSSSDALAYAYGMAVTGTITITTLLFFYIARVPVAPAAVAGRARRRRPAHRGPAVLRRQPDQAGERSVAAAARSAIAAFTVMTTWQTGPGTGHPAARSAMRGRCRRSLISSTSMKPPLARVPGTAVFLNRGKDTAPLAMRANVEHNHVLHEHVLILAIETMPVPHVPASRADRRRRPRLRGRPDRLRHRPVRLHGPARTCPALLPLIRQAEHRGSAGRRRSSPTSCPDRAALGNAPGMSRWRKHLFIATSRITADAAEYFQLPRDRTVIMGSRIEL